MVFLGYIMILRRFSGARYCTFNSSRTVFARRHDEAICFKVIIILHQLSISMKPGFIYILTNYTNTTLYVGVTSDLHARIKQHKDKQHPDSFSARYNLNKLIYFESFQMIEDAITREKQLKGGSRIKKEKLIESINPDWNDIYYDLEKYL